MGVTYSQPQNKSNDSKSNSDSKSNDSNSNDSNDSKSNHSNSNDSKSNDIKSNSTSNAKTDNASNTPSTSATEKTGNLGKETNTKGDTVNEGFTDVYGNINFVTFLSSIYARLAYCTDHNFLRYYQEIFGPIISEEILTAINNQVKNNGIKSIMNDKQMFGLTSGIDKFGLKTYTSDTKLEPATSIEPAPSTKPEKSVKLKPLSTEQSGGDDASGEEQVHLQFLPLAKKINIALGEQRISKDDANCHFDLKECKPDPNLIFIQIANSNYGGIYVFGDRRMPNLITVVFRGTYSVKSAGSYTKLSTITPGIIGKEADIPEEYLTGIFKLISENIHSILYAMTYVSNQLGTQEKQILTTGHSLGGGLTTIFSYLWVAHITSNKKYRGGDYALLNPNICCISIASPRVLSKELASLFCCLTDDIGNEINAECKKMLEQINKSRKNNERVNIIGRIAYVRNTMYSDPVTTLPLKGSFQHPCSNIDITSAKTRKAVTSDCYVQIKNSASTRCWTQKKRALLRKPIPDKLAITMDYNMPLDCVDTKEKRKASKYKSPSLLKMPMGYHIMYNGISFAGGLDPFEFLASANPLKSREESKEIVRTTVGDTVCRIIVYPSPKTGGSSAGVAYFDLSKLRNKNEANAAKSKIHQKLSTSSAEKAIEAEDLNYTDVNFKELIKKVTDYNILNSKASLNGTKDLIVFTVTKSTNVGDNTLIRYNAPPPLINPSTVTGGKRNKKRKKTKRKNKCKSKLKNKNNRKTRKIHRK